MGRSDSAAASGPPPTVPPGVMVRQAVPADVPFLLRVLAIAADWQPGVEPRAVVDVLAAPELAHYVPDLEAHDRGLVIEDEKRGDAGAAWWRFFDAGDSGYGFVAAAVPEVTIGVLADSRGRGLGSRLLRELIVLAQIEGLPGLSLSVEPRNPAARLYRRLGFVQVGTNGGSATMLLSLRHGGRRRSLLPAPGEGAASVACGPTPTGHYPRRQSAG